MGRRRFRNFRASADLGPATPVRPGAAKDSAPKVPRVRLAPAPHLRGRELRKKRKRKRTKGRGKGSGSFHRVGGLHGGSSRQTVCRELPNQERFMEPPLPCLFSGGLYDKLEGLSCVVHSLIFAIIGMRALVLQ